MHRFPQKQPAATSASAELWHMTLISLDAASAVCAASATHNTLKLETMALVVTRVNDFLVVFGAATMPKGAVYEPYAILDQLTLSMDSRSKI